MFLVILFLAGATRAFAAWTDDFLNDYEKYDIFLAVENAIDNDVTAEEILIFIISNEKINVKATLKALYCAGVDREEIRKAAVKLGVPAEKLARALEESIAECGSKLVLDDRENSGINASPSRPGPIPPARPFLPGTVPPPQNQPVRVRP
jgi:hypothetical protein